MPTMKKRATTTSFATLCSLALIFWAYQAGAWQFAVPMILLLEARHFIPRRWTISSQNFQVVHVVGGFLWLVSIFYVPANSPTEISYSALYHILKALPVGLFPLVLAQTYCANFTAFYRTSFSQYLPSKSNLNLYYPYFGICLFAAAATGGHIVWFLTVTALLVAGLLGTLRSQRFSLGTFYGLIGLALIVSLMGTYQYYWLQANFKPNGAEFFSNLIQKVASLAPEDSPKQPQELPKAELPEADQIPEKVAATFSSQTVPQPSEGTTASQGVTPQSTPPSSRGSQASEAGEGSARKPEAATANPSSQSANSGNSNSEMPAVGTSQNTAQSSGSSGSNPAASSANAQSTGASSVASSQGNTPSSANSGTGNPGSGQGTTSLQGPNQQGEGAASSNPAQISSNTPPNSNGITNSTAQPSPTGGASGAINPQTSVSQIGNKGTLQLSDAVLFRVTPLKSNQSPAFPLYIRLAAYNQYDLGRWDAVQSTFVPKASAADKQRWTFGSQTSGMATVRISETLQQGKGVLKLPIGTSAVIQLDVDSMEMNQYGTVVFQGKPGEFSYTVEFDPTRSPDGSPTAQDLEIPQVEQSTLQQILQSLNLRGKSAQERLQAVEAFFGRGFQYSLDLRQPQNGETPLAAFLLDHRAGHCEYFASATSLLLRAAGISTRYTVGYVVDEYSPAEQQYVVRANHAHAWVMAYVNGSWVTVETTPGGGLSPLSGLGDGSTAAGSTSQSDLSATSSQTRTSENDRADTVSTQQGQTQAGKSLSEGLSEAWSSLRSFFFNQSDTGAPTSEVKEKKTAQKDQETQSSKQKDSQKESTDQNAVQKTKAKEGKSFAEQVSELWTTLRNFLTKHRNTLLWASAIATLGLAIIIGSILVAWKALRRQRPQPKKGSRRNISHLNEQPVNGPDSEFYRIEQRLAEWGLERQSSETPRQWIARLKQKLPESQMNQLNQIIDLHYRHRFDPEGITEDDRDHLNLMIQSWLKDTTAKALTK
jgi:protein-glutamine gamma-glutamyltransferase